jgi:hypothetical protein
MGDIRIFSDLLAAFALVLFFTLVARDSLVALPLLARYFLLTLHRGSLHT